MLEVRNPYTNAVVGTVPAATPEHVRAAFAKRPRVQAEAHAATSASASCSGRPDALLARTEEIARLITSESGLCIKDSLYEVGRACDVFSLAGQLAIEDDGEIFACDSRPHGKARKIFTHARAAARA